MADRQAAVLAIDGGNSKTDLALIGWDGTVLAALRGPGASQNDYGIDGARSRLADLIRMVAEKAGIDVSGIVAPHISACLAGADLPEEEAALTAALLSGGWSDTAVAANDAFAILRGGVDEPWGVAVTCGAGINCVAVAPDGTTARYLAHGTMTGDWGGGWGLGQAVMWHAMRGWDGRGLATALGDAVAAHFGFASIRDVAVAVHKGVLGETDLIQLTAVLFAVAADGDPVARSLVDRQAAEICVMAAAALRQLGMPPAGVPVVLGGGVLESRDPLLLSEIDRHLAEAAPGATSRLLDVPPIAGAALLGLDYLGAPTAPKLRLRACYRALTGRESREQYKTTKTGRRDLSLQRTSPTQESEACATSPPNVAATATGSLLSRERSPHKTGHDSGHLRRVSADTPGLTSLGSPPPGTGKARRSMPYMQKG